MEVTVTPPVTIALRTLGEEDRRRVTSWFHHLQNWEIDEFVRSHSHPLPSDASVYVLRTNSDFRIFFTFDKSGIVILDLARKEALDGFERASGKART